MLAQLSAQELVEWQALWELDGPQDAQRMDDAADRIVVTILNALRRKGEPALPLPRWNAQRVHQRRVLSVEQTSDYLRAIAAKTLTARHR